MSVSIVRSQAVIGIGIDIEETKRFERMFRRPARLLEQVFSRDELAMCRAQPEPVAHLAMCFAIKEATFKALGQGWLESSLFWADVELLSPQGEAPVSVRLNGPVLQRCREMGGASTFAGLCLGGSFVIAQIVVVSGRAGK